MKFWRCTCCGEDWIAPKHKVCSVCGGDDAVEEYQPPITLRDFFAGCALIAEMLDTAIEKVTCPPETEARAAYLIADAMLKAREDY